MATVANSVDPNEMAHHELSHQDPQFGIILLIFNWNSHLQQWDISRNVRKYTFGHVRQGKIQISLCIQAVWSESSLSTFWIAKETTFLPADND